MKKISEIEKKRKEIEELKKEFKLKKEVFEMLKFGKNKNKIKDKIEKNNLLSFFQQIKWGDNELISYGLNDDINELGSLNYHIFFEEIIKNKLLEEEKQIEEKEIRLENFEYIKIQKKAIEEDKVYKKELNFLTTILAIGVFGQLVYYFSLYFNEIFPSFSNFFNVVFGLLILIPLVLVGSGLFLKRIKFS